MKILFVITGLGMGGAENVVTSLADAMVAKSHEVRIAYMTCPAVVLPKNPNISVICLGMISKADVFKAFFRLNSLIREFQPDVVHSHMVHANIMVRFVRLIAPIKRLISTAHSSNEGGKLRMLAYRLTDRLADLSTNVSAEAVSAFVNDGAVKPGRMLAVHNGIDTDAFAFCYEARTRLRAELLQDEGSKLLLAVGRLHEAKDYPNLFRAIAQLDGCNLKYQLCVVGDGQLRASLEKLVDDFGLNSRVRFLGIRRDVADLMSAADIFVLSSAWEGFPTVVMEAMANERLVVATDCGGVREAVGSTGFLVRPKDPMALARKLSTALQLPPDEAALLGYAARQRVLAHYSLDAVVDNWLNIYKNKSLDI